MEIIKLFLNSSMRSVKVIARFLRRRIADEHELRDICQETLLVIYKSRHTYQPSRALEPWLFAIARHVGATHFKRYASRVAWQEITDELPEAAASDSGYSTVRFREAFAQLPESQREALVLIKLDGLSLREACKRTGSSVGALKLRVHRAYEALKTNLLG
jgi:RNA polymerase sigma-70 factor (ECF subfamily)